MSERLKDQMLRVWLRLRHEERGAQTLEWLALALLILGILGAGATVLNDGAFVTKLKEKFIELVGKIT